VVAARIFPNLRVGFQVAECGNLETFQRLYFADTSRLGIKDSRGRTAGHQAAAKNKINILQFILSQGGGESGWRRSHIFTRPFPDLNSQDNAGNTPLHVAVEHESLDAVDFLLQA
jgi:transient receptor potential cation channel subfamily A protein 1